MIPDSCQWRPWLHGPALYLGADRVATVSRMPTGGARVTFCPPGALMFRHEFFPSLASAMCATEEWAATKW